MLVAIRNGIINSSKEQLCLDQTQFSMRLLSCVVHHTFVEDLCSRLDDLGHLRVEVGDPVVLDVQLLELGVAQDLLDREVLELVVAKVEVGKVGEAAHEAHENGLVL